MLNNMCCYKKYLKHYSWVYLRKKLSDENINYKEKNELNNYIFNDYKFRSCVKVKKIKILNNISKKELYKYALMGLNEAIDKFNPNDKINFAKHSDIYIDKYLIIGLYNLSPYKNEIQFNYNKWYDPYWNCINNNLSPLNKKIIQLKYNYVFDEIRQTYIISKMFNTTNENITDIITTSLNYVYKKIRARNEFSDKLFLSKLKKS
jgi:DNA-directed RNA polymerase specialized sigma subunit